MQLLKISCLLILFTFLKPAIANESVGIGSLFTQFNAYSGDLLQVIHSSTNYVAINNALFGTSYKQNKKDPELNVLLRNEDTYAQKIHSQHVIILLTITAGVLSTLLSFILFYFFKQQRKLGAELKERHKRLAKKNTNLLKREKELRESNEAKSKLFSIIAHDIKNPLYAMLRLGDILEDKYDKHTDEKRKEYLHYLNQAGKELVNLTENLLSWSRYQLGNIKYNPNYFSVLESVEFAVGFFRHMASLKEIDLQIKVSPNHMAYADMSMVIMVIRNLANNAVKFTKRKGCIQIISSEDFNSVKISIVDNGVGINKEQLSKMFLIEKDTSQIGTEGEKGSGLGLALCKEFVEKNHGKIGVLSKYGNGSEFWFTLPIEKSKK